MDNAYLLVLCDKRMMSIWNLCQSEKIMLIKLFVITIEHKFSPPCCPVINLKGQVIHMTQKYIPIS